jgi:hypothetical protein
VLNKVDHQTVAWARPVHRKIYFGWGGGAT